MLSRRSKHSDSYAVAAALIGIGGAWLFDSRRRASEASLVHRTMVELLLNTLCSGDPDTARHSRRVADVYEALSQPRA